MHKETEMSVKRAVALYQITDRRSDEAVREHQNGPKQLVGYLAVTPRKSIPILLHQYKPKSRICS